jgi:outer membrane protein OmpA-like peptidoglycan-associated protein
MTSHAAAAYTTQVDLLTAANYSVLSPAVTNLGVTTMTGDLGTTGALPAVLPTVSGTTRLSTDPLVTAAMTDVKNIYDALRARTQTSTLAGDLIGRTLTSGVYFAGAAIANSGTLKLDGENDPNAVFIFQIGAAFGVAAASKILLINQASANNVYWVTLGAIGIGAAATFSGIAVTTAAIGAGAGAIINGRLLTSSAATAAVALDSNIINSVTGTVSPAPASVVATVLDQTRISLAIGAPTTNGGSPITSYEITSSPQSLTMSSTGTTAIFTGLTAGTTYSFSVKARNGMGLSPATLSNSVTTLAASLPSAPTSLVAKTASQTSVSVAFTPPTNNGGSPITSYTATSNPGGVQTSSSSSPIVVTGLTPATAYTFTVTANNSVGSSLASVASNSATTFTAGLGVVNLGSASTFSILGGSAVNNTGASTSAGNIGAPSRDSRPDPQIVITAPNAFHDGDPTYIQAMADLRLAIADAQSRTGGTAVTADISGATFTRGLYTFAAPLVTTTAGTTITLDAQNNPDAVWIFNFVGQFTPGATNKMLLINGAQAANVFFVFGGGFTLGATSSDYTGTYMSVGNISFGATTFLNGSILALGSVNLSTTQILTPPVAVVSAPAFTLSRPSERANTGSPMLGFTAISTGGAVASYSISPAAPAGLTFNTITGALSGTPTPTAASNQQYTITATNATAPVATRTYQLQITLAPVLITAPVFTLSSTTESKNVGVLITGYTITSTGGTITSYSISPTPVAGLSFNSTTGLLTGAPTDPHIAQIYTITATNTAGSSSKTFTLTTTLALPAFTLSQSTISVAFYKDITSYAISSTGGRIASYAVSPAIPAGLIFSTTTGLFSGKPTKITSPTNYTITATNATGSSTATLNLTTTGIDLGEAAKFAVLGGTALTFAVGFQTAGIDQGMGYFVGGANSWLPGGIATEAGSDAYFLANPNLKSLNTALAAQALIDARAAMAQILTLPKTIIPGELGTGTSNNIIYPGIYQPGVGGVGTDAAWTMNSNVILDGGGDPNAIFIFYTAAAVSTAANTKFTMQNGAQAKNIYWSVGAAFSTGADAQVAGRVLAYGAVTTGARATMAGQLLCIDICPMTIAAGTRVLASFPGSASVPTIVGSTTTVASVDLVASGFTLGNLTGTTTINATASNNGKIATQDLVGTASTGAAVNYTTYSYAAPTTGTMPTITGLTVAAATTALSTAGFTIGSALATTTTTTQALDGKIAVQTPAAASVALFATPVTYSLYSYTAAPTTGTMPTITGLTVAAATTALTTALFTGTVTALTTTTTASLALDGKIATQTPAANSVALFATPVTYSLYTYSPVVSPTTGTMPTITGLSLGAANAALTTALFTGTLTALTTTTTTNSSLNNLIAVQTPAAASVALFATPVTYSLYSYTAAPTSGTMPTITGLTVAAATTALSTAGFTIGSALAVTTTTTQALDGKIAVQTPAANSVALFATPVTYSLYSYTAASTGGGSTGGGSTGGGSTGGGSTTPVVALPVITTPIGTGVTTIDGPVNITTITSTGGVSTYSISPTLPAGLIFSPSTGVITGEPTTDTGATIYTITATNTSGTAIVRITLATTSTSKQSDYVATWSDTTLLDGIAGQPYLDYLLVGLKKRNVTDPRIVTYSLLKGALPSGITLNTLTGTFSGIPTSSGVFKFTIAANASGYLQTTLDTVMTIAAAVIDNKNNEGPLTTKWIDTTLKVVTTGAVYTDYLKVAQYNKTGLLSTLPITYRLTAGKLPLGLTLDLLTGNFTGTVKKAGNYAFTVGVFSEASVKLTSKRIILKVADAETSQPTDPAPTPAATSGTTPGVGTVLSSIFFATGDKALDSGDKALLKKLITTLKSKNITSITITGYADAQGKTGHTALSIVRAATVASFLKANRVSVKIAIAGKGVLPSKTANSQTSRKVVVTVSA